MTRVGAFLAGFFVERLQEQRRVLLFPDDPIRPQLVLHALAAWTGTDPNDAQAVLEQVAQVIGEERRVFIVEFLADNTVRKTVFTTVAGSAVGEVLGGAVRGAVSA